MVKDRPLGPLHLAAQDWRAADAETRRLLDRWIHPSAVTISVTAP